MADEKSYNISIETKAQLEEIQKLLVELRAISAEISKINGLTFSAVSMSAAELSKTGKDLAEAIIANKKAFEELPKATDKAGDGTKKFREESKKTKEGVDGLKSATEGFFLELGAMASRFAVQLPSAITKSIEAFGQQEMALQKLSAAVRANGGNVSEVLPIMSAFASEMQRITTYGDEQVLAMQAMATSMGVDSMQMEGVIKSAIGLASALNMDVMTAIKASSAAVQGKTGMLQEYIPALAKCKTEEEKLATVQKLSASGFAQAKAEAETSIGKLKQLSNAWGDLAETAGGMFAPAAADVAVLLREICAWIAKSDTRVLLLTETLSALAIAFSFSKIGGLTSVVRMFKLVSLSMRGTTLATIALSNALKATPWGAVLGLATSAVMGLSAAYSYFSEKAKKAYESNIEQSKEYRDGIDAEIDAMKQWGISAEDNKKRTADVAEEIKRLKAEQIEYQKSHGSMRGSYGGVMYKVYSEEEQAAIDNYRAKIEKLEERQKAAAEVKELDALAEKNHAAALKASEEILARSAEEMRAAKSATEALKLTREKYAATEKEIAELEKAFDGGKIADSERVAKAERLRQARLELLELGKREIEQELALSSSKYASLKTAELKNQNDLEVRLAGARLRGNTAEAKSLELELEGAKTQRKRLDIITAYISARKSEIKTAEDLNRIQADAARYANATLEFEKQKADSEKWLNGEIEKNKAAQRDMEVEILRARASGNEAGAKELELKLKIAQTAAEIFEATRKEGMSRDELERLQASANEKAREKCELEKSITDEIERQNLAKDAQAKIEDILLTNKIEQLKAEGKLTEARELEREREIKRTLAGMKGLSDADKESIASTMRQTNDYRDRQEKIRKAGGGASYSGGAGGSMPARGGSFGGSQSGYGGGAAKYAGPTPPRRPRPASVSAKYRGLYDEWKAAGGSQSGESWTDYRMRRAGEVDAESEERNAYEETRRADENAPVSEKRARAGYALREAAEKSRDMGSRVRLPKPGGALRAAANSVPNEAPRKAPRAGGGDESESSENRQRRTQTQTKSQNMRQQTAQLSNPTLEILREILMNVKSLRESD